MFIKALSHWRHCRRTVGQNIDWQREQVAFGFSVGQCLVSYENSARYIRMRHSSLSVGEVKICLSCDLVDRGLNSSTDQLSDRLTSTLFHPPIVRLSNRSTQRPTD